MRREKPESQSPFGLGGPSDFWNSKTRETRSVACSSQSPFGLGGPSDYNDLPRWNSRSTGGGLNRLSAWVVPPTHVRIVGASVLPCVGLNRLSAWVVPPTHSKTRAPPTLACSAGVSIAFRLGWSLRRRRERQGWCACVRRRRLNRLSAWVVPPTKWLDAFGPTSASLRLNRLSAWVVPPTYRRPGLATHAQLHVSIAFRLGWSLRPGACNARRSQGSCRCQSQSPFGLGGPSDPQPRSWPCLVSSSCLNRLSAWVVPPTRIDDVERWSESRRLSQSPFGLGGPSDQRQDGRNAPVRVVWSQSPFGLGGPSDRCGMMAL